MCLVSSLITIYIASTTKKETGIITTTIAAITTTLIEKSLFNIKLKFFTGFDIIWSD